MNRTRLGMGAAVTALTLAAGAGTAAAGEFDVTTKRADGEGSFAVAVKRANKKDGGDQITFAKSLRGSIDLPEEVVTLRGKLVIDGNGYGVASDKNFGRLVLSGHRGGSELSADREANVSLRGLYFDGVALEANRARLTVKDSFLDGERTVDETGVTSKSGILRVLGSTVQEFDRGITSNGEGRIDESTIADNEGGGGVSVNGTADISNSTISGNVISGDPSVRGGGISVSSYGSTARVTNSTIVRNQAIGNFSIGGGVVGDVELINSTVASNRAASAAGVSGAGAGSDVDLANSIVFGNETFGQEASDCGGSFTSSGGNVVGAPGECVLDPDDVSTDPLLGQLADNGGPTETMTIGAGSPAIGLAIEATATKFDQRGVRRGDDPDAGAFQRRG